MMISVLMFLLTQAVQAGSAWSVTFENPDVCVLLGSSVEFRCSYSYPDEESVRETEWQKGEMKNDVWTTAKLSDLPSYQSRYEYRGDLQNNCSLVLHDVQFADSGYYYFWLDTNKFGRRSKNAVFLTVTGLKPTVNPSSVRAGGNVSLQCTECNIPNVVWFKDGQAMAKHEFQAQAEDAGKYSCGIKGQESRQSQPASLEVLYSPLNVSVELSRSGLLSVGSRVNLTCSSSAVPAADTYTWFRRDAPNSSSLLQVESGQVLSLSSVSLSHTGVYICQAKNYLGQNMSADVLLTVDEGVELISPFIILGAGISIIILLLVLLIIIWAWRRRKQQQQQQQQRCDSAAKEENDSHDYENIMLNCKQIKNQ